MLSVRKALRVAETGSLITARWLQLHISKLQPGSEAEHAFAVGACTISCVQCTLPAQRSMQAETLSRCLDSLLSWAVFLKSLLDMSIQYLMYC